MNTRPQATLDLPSRTQVAAEAQLAARKAEPWVEWLGRFGHAAHGIVYGTVGLLAAQAALGAGGAATDPEGVFDWMVEASFGRLLLVLFGVALISYALWRFVQAARDTEAKGESPSGLAARAGMLGSGVAHLGLGLSGLLLGLGARSPADHDAVPEWTAKILDAPFGELLVMGAGVLVLCVAVSQGLMAFRSDFARHHSVAETDPLLTCWLMRLGRLGYASRAVVFALVGAFLIHAALDSDPGHAHGLGGTLSVLASQPYGSGLLCLVALGLLAFGAFELAESRFRLMQKM
jgi:hypothetical protein